MQEPIASAKKPNRRGRAKLLAGSVALTMATFGGVVAVTAGTAYAFSSVESQAYTITGAAATVTGVTAADNPSTFANPGPTVGFFTIKYVTPSALTPSTVVASASCVYISDSDPVGAPNLFNEIVSEASIASVGIVDANTGYANTATVAVPTYVTLGTGAAATQTTANSLKVCLPGTGSINPGDTITLTFAADNPAVPAAGGDYNFWVATTANTSFVEDAAPIDITPAVGAETVTANTAALNSGATYSLTNIPAAAGPSGTTTTILVQDCAAGANGVPPATLPCTLAEAGGVTLSTVASSYTVTDATTGDALTVNSATVGIDASSVSLSVSVPTGDAVAATDLLTITAVGTNPAAEATNYFVVSGLGITPVGGVHTGALTFGGVVTGVTASVSNNGTLATGVTWTIGFSASATGAMPVATVETITVQGPSGTNFDDVTGALVTDTTTGVSQVVGTAGLAFSTTTTTDDTVTITTTLPVADSNAIALSLFGVTNPALGSYTGTTGVQVKTAADPTLVGNTTALVIGPTLVSTASPAVMATPLTPGTLATYTIGPFKAADALVGGTDTIQVEVLPTSGTVNGTELPGSATLTDATTSTGTQTLTETLTPGTAETTYKLSANVAAGDTLSLTLADVVNPAGGSYNIYLGADSLSNTDSAGTQGLATPQISFAGGASTYPDASIINFSGTDYVFAGGHPFGVPSPTVLAGVQAVDHATALTAATGATVPTTAAATGSVIVVYNNPTIYVVGTDGQLHGFATPAQFLGDGFDPADVITVPNTGGLTVGATAGSVGTGANALATSANGAIVNSSGTYYVFAGSRAFGIPTPTVLSAIIAGDTATPLIGTIGTTNTTAAIRNGTLVTLKGAVYVASAGQLQEFKSFAQLAKDGYGGTPSILVPNAGGLALVSTYSGS